jgi:hypothetical protein
MLAPKKQEVGGPGDHGQVRGLVCTNGGVAETLEEEPTEVSIRKQPSSRMGLRNPEKVEPLMMDSRRGSVGRR